MLLQARKPTTPLRIFENSSPEEALVPLSDAPLLGTSCDPQEIRPWRFGSFLDIVFDKSEHLPPYY